MTNILEKILDQKRLEIAALDAQALRRAAEQSPTPRDTSAHSRNSKREYRAMTTGEKMFQLDEPAQTHPSATLDLEQLRIPSFQRLLR